MTYALRKLIAFVFLGGLFWFIYQDLGNLEEAWFMHALGMLVVVFAIFWLLVPMVVVRLRIRRRVAKNRERHARWLEEGGVAGIRELPPHSAKLSLQPGERAVFHEKGTLYIDRESTLFAGDSTHPVGRPSDVAFPDFRRDCRVAQRTHCYFTDRRVAFAGKDLEISIPLAELASASTAPGGIVFRTGSGESTARFAFTFRNPLVAADILVFAKAMPGHVVGPSGNGSELGEGIT